jgi:hypothetical protein
MAYHYPQQPGQQPAPGNPRQGLSSLEPVSQQSAEYGAYQPAQPPAYGQAPPAHAQQRGFNPNGAPDYRQWSQSAPAPDQHAYPPQQDPLQAQAEWAQHSAHFGYGEPPPEESYQGGQQGYQQQPHQNTLEQGYAPDEIADYEIEEGRRGSWTMRIAGAIVVAIGLGYGLAQGYKLVAGAEPDGATPVVHSDTEPARTAPTDPGGKQFAHADSKVMGRLGEATPGGSEAASEPASSGSDQLSDTDTDASGARKVTTLVVGRDGSIAPPAAPEAPAVPAEGETSDSVPGLTVVDGFGGRFPGAASPSAAPAQKTTSAPAAEAQPAVAKPSTPEKPEVIAAVKTTPEKPAAEPVVLTTTTSDPAPAAEKPPAALPPPNETAAIPSTPAAAPQASTSSSGANGYVVVLASVPVSGQSRLSALKKFADMQEKYGMVLQNKTPDVQEANLGEKGSYHRLLVGPPVSRAQASSLCSDLKTAGYKDCWVTAY